MSAKCDAFWVIPGSLRFRWQQTLSDTLEVVPFRGSSPCWKAEEVLFDFREESSQVIIGELAESCEVSDLFRR